MIVQQFETDWPLAPEINAGKPHDFSADVWSLGHLLNSLLAVTNLGETIGLNQAVAATAVEQTSSEADSLVDSMTEKWPEDRPTMDEVYSHEWLSQSISSTKSNKSKSSSVQQF